ncbi:MAG: hypothetical protein KME43_13080 [Myxacorys chilensis ATA2-1-KO14]|jgi:hypothetical protein|nr:hypothetical protein [Myxacorys chilensis ATA2-1-KO14]
MALKTSWQHLRQQRQQHIIQRRQQVASTLENIQTYRQETASELRCDLSLFRDSLMRNGTVCRQERQRDRTELHHQTQTFLRQARDRRQVQAQEGAQQLTAFVIQLRSETSEFLAVTHANRELMAQQLAYDLAAFRAALDQASTLLRQKIRADIQTSQTETSLLLEAAHQQRIATRIQLNQELADVAEQEQPALPSIESSERADVRVGNEKQSAEQIQPSAAKPAPIQPAPAVSEERLQEERIFQYIDLMQSVRLTELETSLSMSRFQVVEALRSLIQKGMITQRDRMYCVSEEVY